MQKFTGNCIYPASFIQIWIVVSEEKRDLPLTGVPLKNRILFFVLE